MLDVITHFIAIEICKASIALLSGTHYSRQSLTPQSWNNWLSCYDWYDLSHTCSQHKAIITVLSVVGFGVDRFKPWWRFGCSSVIEYFHCQANKSVMIMRKMLTKELLSLHCKQHADISSFEEKFVIIVEVLFCLSFMSPYNNQPAIKHLIQS